MRSLIKRFFKNIVLLFGKILKHDWHEPVISIYIKTKRKFDHAFNENKKS